jgi:hypothetical protein
MLSSRSIVGLLAILTMLIATHHASALSYQDTVLADNPLAYYRFSEVAGVSATDQTGNGNTGTYIGGADLTAPGSPLSGFGTPNSATGFNGSNAAVNTNVSLSGLGAFTLELWVNPAAAQTNRTGLVGQNDAIEFGFINANTIQLWTPSNGALNVAYSSGGNAGEWIHVVGVGTGTQKLVYINGVLAGTQNHGATANYGTSGFFTNIGGDGVYDGGGNWFNGTLDEVAIYGEALGADQIQAHFNSRVPEPATAALGVIGIGLLGMRRRRNG